MTIPVTSGMDSGKEGMAGISGILGIQDLAELAALAAAAIGVGKSPETFLFIIPKGATKLLNSLTFFDVLAALFIY